MKLLEIEAIEYTTPTIEPDHGWQPITVKIKQTNENSKIIGKQLQKQLAVYNDEGKFNGKFTIGSDEWLLQCHLSYKFVIDTDEWLLEGCWFPNVNYFTYSKDSYMEITVRFDNATEKQC